MMDAFHRWTFPKLDAYRVFLLVVAGILVLGALTLRLGHEPATPDLRVIQEDRPVFIMGASIGHFPVGEAAAQIEALRGHLPNEVLDRALIRHGQSDSIWLAAATRAEAFALCARLLGIRLECGPTVVPLDELRGLDGNLIGETTLPYLGISPYRPMTSPWSKVVILTSPATFSPPDGTVIERSSVL